MAKVRKIKGAWLLDVTGEKRLVSLGDKVALLPIERRHCVTDDEKTILDMHIKVIRDEIGDGPHTLNWVGRDPTSGKKILYLDVGRVSGYDFRDFMAVTA